jgi:hypothetical protein
MGDDRPRCAGGKAPGVAPHKRSLWTTRVASRHGRANRLRFGPVLAVEAVMLDTRLIPDVTLRCDALFDRIQATPVGANAHTLRIAMAECDALERGIGTPLALCKLRDARHWLRLAYGDTLHGYPSHRLRAIVLEAIADVGRAVSTSALA